MARAGALEPLDPYIEKYGVKEEFDDIAPAFKDWMTFDGKTYAPRRRWRRAPPLLPQGHLRGSGEQGGVQGEVRLRPRPAADLEGVRRGLPVHHRQVRARDLRRRPDQHRLHALLLLGALPHLRRQVLRRRDDEGDGQQPGGRRGADRHGRAAQVPAAGRARPGASARTCRR